MFNFKKTVYKLNLLSKSKFRNNNITKISLNSLV